MDWIGVGFENPRLFKYSNTSSGLVWRVFHRGMKFEISYPAK